MNVLDCLGHGKHWGRRVALLAVGSVPAAADVVVANVVFAGERVFIVPRTFVNRSTFRAATLTVMHTGFHFSLAFHYARKSSTNRVQQANYSHMPIITKRLAGTDPAFPMELTFNSRRKPDSPIGNRIPECRAEEPRGLRDEIVRAGPGHRKSRTPSPAKLECFTLVTWSRFPSRVLQLQTKGPNIGVVLVIHVCCVQRGAKC